MYHNITKHTTICSMSKKAAIPDAWDDDWESQADKADAITETPKVEEPVKVSKAERLAKHAEINKKIWEDAYAMLKFWCISLLTVLARNPRHFIS